MENSTKNKIGGKMREMKGKAKEAFGEATNNPDVEARGKAEKLGGKAQGKMGDVQKVFND